MAKKIRNKAVKSNSRLTASKKKYAFQISGISWLLIVMFLVTVVYTSTTTQPGFAIRNVLLSILTLAYLGYYFFYKKHAFTLNTPIVKWFFGLWIGSWIWGIVASLQAINVPEAFIVVGQEFLQIAIIILVVSFFSKERKNFPLLLKALTLLAFVHSLVGILQYSDLWVTPTQIQSPFGFAFNRTVYGSLLALLFPFAFGQFLAGSVRWRIFGGVAVMLEIVALIFSQCRSAWVATTVLVILANVLAVVYRERFSKKQLKRWFSVNIAGASLIVIALILAVQFNMGGHLIQSTAERISSLVGTSSQYTASSSTKNERLLAWEQCLYMVKDNPVMGVGSGNWKLAAPPYLKDIPSISVGDIYMVRAHNSWLQIGVERGIPGWVAYILAWGILLIIAYRVINQTKGLSELIFYMSTCGGIAVLAVDMVFSFPLEHISHTALFAIFAGILISVYDQNGNTDTTKSAYKLPGWGIAIITGLLVLNSIYAYQNLRFQQIWSKTFLAAGSNKLEETIQLNRTGKEILAKPWPQYRPNRSTYQCGLSKQQTIRQSFGGNIIGCQT